MVHSEFPGGDLPTTVMANAAGPPPLPPLRLTQFSRPIPLAPDLFFADKRKERFPKRHGGRLHFTRLSMVLCRGGFETRPYGRNEKAFINNTPPPTAQQ